MNKSQDLSDSCDVTRTAPQPTPLTHTTPDDADGVKEVNRPQRSLRRAHGSGNEPALNSAVPRTVGSQQHPPTINNAVRRSNNDNRQRDMSRVRDNAVLQLGGLAEQRQYRSHSSAGLDTGPTSSQEIRWVTPGRSDSPKPAIRMTDDKKREQQQLKEKGGACLRCQKEQKACDREDICSKCRLPRPGANPTGEATLCLRGIEKLWLWGAVYQPSLDRSSRSAALHSARKATFADSSQKLRELLGLGQTLPGNDGSVVAFLTSKLGHGTAPSRIVISPGSLAEKLQLMPKILTKYIRKALAAHIPDLVLSSLQSRLTEEENSLVASAQSAFRVYNFISNAAHVKYHASARFRISAREVGCFLIEYCVRLLATEVEEVLEKIRSMIRQKNPSDVPKHAFGLYYGILLGLQQLDTQTALDVVLDPLKLRASVVIRDLSLLYRDIYGSKGTLQDFVNRDMPAMSEVHHLHLSHDLSPIDNPITSWNFTSDPFHKDFSVDLPDLLVRDGKVAWTQELNSVQHGVPSLGCVDAPDNSPLPRGRSEASELRSSPNATLRDTPWGDGSTYIESPTEAVHGAELRRGNQVQVGDVKTPQDLLCITGGSTGTHSKRGRSLESGQCTPPSPPPKRPELDAEQAYLGNAEHYFDDVANMMGAIEASGPSSWDPQWEPFFNLVHRHTSPSV